MSHLRKQLLQVLRGETRKTLSNSLLALVFSFGCGVFSARLLGPSDRGVLTLMLVIATTAGLVAALGSNVAIRVTLGSDQRAQMRSYVTLSALLALLQCVLVTGAVLVLGSALGLQSMLPTLVAWGLTVGLAVYVSQQSLDALNAIGRTATSALANAVGSFVSLIGLIVAFVLHLGLWTALFSYAFGASVTALHAVVAYRRDVAHIRSDVGSRSYLLRRGVGLLGLNLGQALALKLDHYAVAIFSGAAATGIYAVAAAHAAPTQVSSFAVGQVVLYQASRGMLTRRRLARFLAFSTGIAALLCVVVWLVAPWFVPVVFGADFSDSVPVLRVLMLGQVALAPYLICTRVIAGGGRSRLASLSGISLIALLGILLVILTPQFGPLGAAWATTLGFVAASTAMMVVILIGSSTSTTREASADDDATTRAG